MRITNTTIARNYNSSLNKNLERLNRANMEVAASGRKIFSMSDDTATGVRALNVRRSLSQLEGYMDNAKNAKTKFDGAEQSLGQIADMAQSIYARYNYAINGTNSDTERDIIANEFRKMQGEILTSANGQYADKYIFGGTNTHSAPFTVGDDGKLLYNNVKVELIGQMGGQNDYQYLIDDAAYVDIGLGMTMVGSSQQVDPNSALKNTINGLDFMGMGPDNLYDTITQVIESLESSSFDASAAGVLLDKVRDAGNNVTLQRTRMGADIQYLEYTVTRLETEEYNLIERQDTLEFRDPAESIMDFTMQQYVYNAALQMGSRLLQPTIFSFIS